MGLFSSEIRVKCGACHRYYTIKMPGFLGFTISLGSGVTVRRGVCSWCGHTAEVSVPYA